MRTLALVVLLLSAAAGSAAADPASEPKRGGLRVRPNDDRVAAVLRVGLERSATLRALVDRIEDGYVIVYLEMQPRLRPHLAGCVSWVTAAGAYRYVRASINPDLSLEPQIATIAHELRHVQEIIENPQVTSEASLVALYQRIGTRHPSGKTEWDTVAAQDVTATVRRELSKAAVPTVADSSRPVSPPAWTGQDRQGRLRGQGGSIRNR